MYVENGGWGGGGGGGAKDKNRSESFDTLRQLSQKLPSPPPPTGLVV